MRTLQVEFKSPVEIPDMKINRPLLEAKHGRATDRVKKGYLPKGKCFNNLTQAQCDRIAHKLNTRPRKRYGYRTPEELFN